MRGCVKYSVCEWCGTDFVAFPRDGVCSWVELCSIQRGSGGAVPE